jgi:hypothetical protein
MHFTVKYNGWSTIITYVKKLCVFQPWHLEQDVIQSTYTSVQFKLLCDTSITQYKTSQITITDRSVFSVTPLSNGCSSASRLASLQAGDHLMPALYPHFRLQTNWACPDGLLIWPGIGPAENTTSQLLYCQVTSLLLRSRPSLATGDVFYYAGVFIKQFCSNGCFFYLPCHIATSLSLLIPSNLHTSNAFSFVWEGASS